MAEGKRQFNMLVISRDPTLKAELDAAMDSLAVGAVAYFVGDPKQGLETARAALPDVICIEAGSNTALVRSFARDVLAVAPEALLAAIYHQQDFAGGQSESRFVVEVLRAGVQDFLRRPLSSSEIQHVLDRLHHRAGIAETRRGKILSFISNRGGAGKSTLALSCAVGLATRYPDRVLLVDASLQLGVCATMLGLTPPVSIADVERERDRLDETFLHQATARHASGLRLLAAPTDPLDAPGVTEETMTRILGLARRTFDYTIVDTFPILDSLVMTVLDLSDVAYVVIQSAVPAVKGIGGLLQLLDKLNFPEERRRLVLNHNFEPFAGDLSVNDVAEALGQGIHHAVPYDKGLLLAANIGKPFILECSQKAGFGKSVRELLDEIDVARGAGSANSTGEGGWVERLSGWVSQLGKDNRHGR